MLQKLAVVVLVVASFACVLSCGKTGNHFLYATIPATNQIAVFREDPYSGVLTQLSESPYNVGSGPQSAALHPSGKYLYVSNAGQGENDISLFDINSDGTITEVTPRTATGTLPFLLAMDPGGAFLYCANVLSNSLSVFSISSSGSLTPLGNSPFTINLSPKNMQISPSGKFLFISAPSQVTGLVATFSLTAGVPAFVSLTSTADNDPSGLAVSPNGSYLYTANSTANSVSIYSIGSSGALTPVTGSPLSANFQHPVAVTVDPKGAYLYVADQGTSQGTTGGSSNIASFSISSSTGFPAAVTDSPFASESESSFVVLDPTGPYLFVGNQASNAGVQAFGVSAGSLNTIASYSVGNTPSSIVILQ
ncbi:MAG: beta-propeller fold lactonase family protein [Candidatus Sulfotelmatobacter sp.]|jgi:6-phosphogluconolactonase (cycloisomerase 2 family)